MLSYRHAETHKAVDTTNDGGAPHDLICDLSNTPELLSFCSFGNEREHFFLRNR